MSQIDRTGTFRFQAVDAGLAETKNGFPQWVAQLQAVEFYDEETEQWIDWSGYEEREITYYGVLFGGDGNPTLNAKQLQKALGWSGASFEELEYEHIADVTFQGRVEEHTYDGVTTLRVNWIDHYDAEPGRVLQKLDTDQVKALNARFASKLRDLSGGQKPRKVDKEALKAAKKEELEAKKEDVGTTKAKRGQSTKSESKPQPPNPPKPPKPPAKRVEKAEKAETIDKGTAWIDCCQERDKSVDDKTLENTWHAAVDSLGGEDAVEENGRWAEVRDAVLAKVGKSPV